jgi:DNA-directed RNA polymerase subunit RPC12/RpoP
MSNDFSEKTADTGNFIKCSDCGANLKFAPGTDHLNCEYCGKMNEIKPAEGGATVVEENDFESFLNQKAATEDKKEISTVKCDNCGAATTLKPNVTSSTCPYCDTALVIKNATTSSIIKPKYVLPFKIERKRANEEFVKWVGSLWFAPGDLKRYALNSAEKLNGVYMPFWTYDTDTTTSYTGLRGDHYYETESYTDSEGKTKTRSVQKTRWTGASGTVFNNFDDVLICASHSLPEKLTRDLEPWDLPELIGYDDRYLSGFVTESYQVDLRSGFESAKQVIAPTIRQTICSDIGGDVQQVTTQSSSYNNITFKHILLPLWISAYRYNDKVYRFMINARTGEVQGERPWSTAKIVLLALAIAAVGLGIWYFATRQH